MLMIVGVSKEREQLDYSQLAVCRCCGREGRLEVFEEYRTLKLLGLRTLCWKKRYEAVMSCCGAHGALEREIGDRVESGRKININPKDLQFTGGRS